MANKWQLMPLLTADFIKKNPEYNKIILQLLFNRGIIDKEQREVFFQPAEVSLSDPFLFKNMKAAAALTIKHIKEQNLIVIYGDYDADGVTAAAALIEILKIFKAKADVYIPGRTSEGYGLNRKALAKLAKIGAKLIITVDNGIRNKAEVDYAKSLGLDIIITDHHEPPDENDWPNCLIINPKAENYAYKSLAGVGVAFKFAQGLIKLSKLDRQIKNKLEEKILDLTAIGTVADMSSLLGENRNLVSRGLEIINRKKRLGLAELIKIAQSAGKAQDKKITAYNIGWQIAPRLNSAGRLDHANTAYELLITKDKNEARGIAKKLNLKNGERQKITKEIAAYCRKVIAEKMADDKILIVCSPNIEKASIEGWPEGVVGLAAGRLCDEYARPVLAITKIKNEIKGSGRSIAEFNIMAAIESSSRYLDKFGGHAAACGFTLKSPEALAEFSREMKKIASRALNGVELEPKILAEAEINLSDINDEFLEALENFEPFGQDNERPKFLSRGLAVMDKVKMGANAQHIKFRFGLIWAMAFSQAENFKDFKIGDKVDVVYYLEFNEFNGRRAAQMKIVDIKACA